MSNIVLAAGGDDGYQISRSVRLRSSASGYFSKTFAAAGDRKKWTYSAWIKRGTLSTYGALIASKVDGNNYSSLEFSGNELRFVQAVGGTITVNKKPVALFRDPSAWYHIIAVMDTDNATAEDRFILYVNGVRVTTWASNTPPALGLATGYINSTTAQWVGLDANPLYFDGYLAEANFIDSQALTQFSFGQFDPVTGVWGAKKYAGTYGTNGFYLNFSDNSAATAAAIGKDSSGNGNNWTPNNISVTAGVTYDSMVDVPTMWADGGNGRGNYAVLNPLAWRTTYSNTVPTNGNLTCTSADNSRFFTATMAEIDKTYFELTATTVSGSGVSAVIWQSENPQSGAVSALSYISATGIVSVLGTTVFTGATFTSGDVIGLAHDSAAGTVAIYKNGALQGTATGLPTSINLYAGCIVGISSVVNANFGQRPFAYTPPTGFKALNTQNLPDATIKKGNAYFDVSLFTGTGSAQTITNSGAMQPDLVWIKGRGEVSSHRLVDAVRGVDKVVYSNLTNAETTEDGVVDSFNSNGFTGGGANAVTSGYAGVAWQWKESASAGFDIVTWTGDGTSSRNINHSLGVAPKMIISKSRTLGAGDAGYWDVYHASLAAQNTLFLHTTGAAVSAPTIWPSAPTSTYFTVGSGSGVNVSGSTMVAFLFAEVAGFSKFGSYTGNGSADGPFVYLGFRPKFVMIKETGASGNWNFIDTSRSTYNAADAVLLANTSGAEIVTAGGAEPIDILSNGFKLKYGGAGDTNTSGGSYIYAAFAENPFKNSLAR